MMNAIELVDVFKRYDRDSRVLEGLDLQVGEGGFLAVIGPSGCGKTTLLNLIGGLDRPDSGMVRVAGADLSELSDRELSLFRNKSVGFIFQTYHLHPRLTAQENAMLPSLVAGLKTEDARARADESLALVGLEDFKKQKPKKLSGGQLQRVAIARALVQEPDILLADEPTGNLDENTGRGILELISTLNRERSLTVMLVTHEADIRAFASQTMTMRNGQIAPME